MNPTVSGTVPYEDVQKLFLTREEFGDAFNTLAGHLNAVKVEVKAMTKLLTIKAENLKQLIELETTLPGAYPDFQQLLEYGCISEDDMSAMRLTCMTEKPPPETFDDLLDKDLPKEELLELASQMGYTDKEVRELEKIFDKEPSDD